MLSVTVGLCPTNEPLETEEVPPPGMFNVTALTLKGRWREPYLTVMSYATGWNQGWSGALA